MPEESMPTNTFKSARYAVWSSLLIALVITTSLSAQQIAKVESPAGLSVTGIFGDGMVLQQQTQAPIWGRSAANAKISVQASWLDAASVAQADADGKWRTKLATPAAGGPFTLSVQCQGERIEFKDVLIGEVWICSGQSNMQWKLRGFGVEHFKADVEKANHPLLRLCSVPQMLSLKPANDTQTHWAACTPQTALSFSAVAYFFGNKLREELNVPIGLISTNWGGSSAEAWMNEPLLKEEFPEFADAQSKYGQLIETHGAEHANNKNKPKGLNQRMPAVLYNKMIHPIIPFSIRGVVWYQGESNVERPVQYRTLFPRLIESWRTEWDQGDFPFYFVQIAPFHYRTNALPAALLREAQLQTLSVPNTGMVVTMDIGNPDNIHPKKKKPVGERLALLALANDYHRTDLVHSGPEFISHEIAANQVRLKFKHVGTGMTTRDGEPLSHFLIAGDDRVFHPAQAKIDGDAVLVESPKVEKPVAARYGWGNSDQPNLMNKEGLPASSFRTDDWKFEPKKPQPRQRVGEKPRQKELVPAN